MGVGKLDLARENCLGRERIEVWGHFKRGYKSFRFNSRNSQNWVGQPVLWWVVTSRNSVIMHEVRILGGLSMQEKKANK